MDGGNIERFREAGLVYRELPDAIAEVLEDLKDDEVGVILSVFERLKAAGEKEGSAPIPQFTAYMTF